MINETDLIQNFINNSGAVMYIKDHQGRYLMLNQQAVENLKLTKEKMLGKTDYDFFSKEDADRFRENDLKVMKAGVPMNFKGKFKYPDGEVTIIDHKFPLSISGVPHAIGGIAIQIKD